MRVQDCGRTPAPGQTPRLVRGEDGSYGFTGLLRCGSVWTCPVCRFHIARHRGSEVTEGVSNAAGLDLHVAFVTLTAHHGPSDPLAPLWESVRKAATRMWQGRRGKAYRERVGYVGRITAHEVTVGASGWHPHVHLLVFSRHPVQAQDVWGLWRRAAEAQGLTVERSAQDVQHVGLGGTDAGTVGRYVSKMATANWTLASEVTDAAGVKVAGQARLAPFQLLDIIGETGDAEAVDLWQEYCLASKGVSSLRWSPGLRDALGVVREELTDEEAANATEHDVTEVHAFSPSEWSAVFLLGLRVELLDAADAEGIVGVRRVVRKALAMARERRRQSPHERSWGMRA